MTQGTQSWGSVTTWRDGVEREVGWGFRMEGFSGWRGHMYTYGLFILMYGKNHHNIAIVLQLNKLKKENN